MSTDFSYRPSQSETIGELAKALNKVQAQLQPAAKNGFNPHFKSNFADLPSIVAASKDPLAANGLSVVQMTGIAPNGDVELVTTLLHISGEWIRGYYPIRSVKGDPQSLGSAFTYARRYAYQAAVGIVSADDDDGNAASDLREHHREPIRNDQGGVRPKITQEDINRISSDAAPARAPKRGGYTDDDLYPYGKHKGTRFGDVPVHYWRWVMENEDFRRKNEAVADYAAARLIALEAASGEEISDDGPPPMNWE